MFTIKFLKNGTTTYYKTSQIAVLLQNVKKYQNPKVDFLLERILQKF